MAAATQPWVASFDDDARPLTHDFFAQALDCTTQFPHAAVLSAIATPMEWQLTEPKQIGVYSGFACIFNQAWFHQTAGFVPLPFAYCMEEVDLCLQLHALGGFVIECPALRVEHESDIPVDSVAFHSRALANIVLFWFIRCPSSLIGRAAYQILRRCVWLLLTCPGAIVPGLAMLPDHLQRHAYRRAPVSATAFRDWLRLCHHPRPAPLAHA
jgi:GT2 family glycosyltransferase